MLFKDAKRAEMSAIQYILNDLQVFHLGPRVVGIHRPDDIDLV
jgi:hypothetical protein